MRIPGISGITTTLHTFLAAWSPCVMDGLLILVQNCLVGLVLRRHSLLLYSLNSVAMGMFLLMCSAFDMGSLEGKYQTQSRRKLSTRPSATWYTMQQTCWLVASIIVPTELSQCGIRHQARSGMCPLGHPQVHAEHHHGPLLCLWY